MKNMPEPTEELPIVLAREDNWVLRTRIERGLGRKAEWSHWSWYLRWERISRRE